MEAQLGIDGYTDSNAEFCTLNESGIDVDLIVAVFNFSAACSAAEFVDYCKQVATYGANNGGDNYTHTTEFFDCWQTKICDRVKFAADEQGRNISEYVDSITRNISLLEFALGVYDIMYLKHHLTLFIVEEVARAVAEGSIQV